MPGNTQRFQQAMNQGHSAAWEQSWDQAASYYRQALEEFPDQPKALTSLGLALYQLQNYSEALKYYRRVVEITPNDPVPQEKVAELLERTGNTNQAADTLMAVAELYIKSRDVSKAIHAWTRVVSLKPENLLAHSRLALVHEHLGRKQQALIEYLTIASLMQHAGEVQKAIQAINHALLIVPESNEAKHALAMLKTGQMLPKPTPPRRIASPVVTAPVREMPPAEGADSRSSNLDPMAETRQRALTTLAGMLFEQFEEDEESQVSKRGFQSIMKGAGILPTPQVDHTKIMLHLSQVVDLQAREQGADAIGELERAIDAGLDHPAAYFDLGYLLAESDRLESALRNLQRAVTHPDFALGSHLLLGRIQGKMGRFKEASVDYLEALKLADSAVVPTEQAEGLRQLYDPVIEAQTHHTDADAQKTLCDNVAGLLNQPNWRENLARARQQLPKMADGSTPMPLAEIITEARSSQVVDSISRIHQLARAGNYRTAMEEAFYALEFAPTYLPLHTYMGELLIQQNRLQDAIDKFSVVAQSYSMRGEASRAIDLFRRITDLSPMDMDARGRLIDQLVARGQTGEAIDEYLKLADVCYSLADLNMARKTFTQALHLAQSANVDRVWKVKILHRMADIDLQSLDWRQALRVFEQIRTLQPDDEKARTTLIDLNLRLRQESQAIAELDGYIAYLYDNKRTQDAIKFLENMIEDNPKQISIRRRLAELYRQVGRTADAISQLDRAGEISLDAGDRNGAAEVIMAILALNPPNAADYQRLLAQIRTS